jgi:hypothetical protein
MRVRAIVIAGALAIVTATAGCSSSSDAGRQTASNGGQIDPLSLVGSWQVTAAGERPGTALILGDELTLFRHCGALMGSWAADPSGAFVGESFGGSGSCFTGSHPDMDVAWLRAAVGYRIHGADRLLLDDSGKVVARLAPGAHPTAGPDMASSFASPPVLTPALEQRFAAAAPVPHSLRPADPVNILGRWRPIGSNAGSPQAFVEFDENGNWSGSDGCNGAGGRYAISRAGEMIAINGNSTLIGCDNSPLPLWITKARRVGIEDRQLVLLDVRGHILGRLTRQS